MCQGDSAARGKPAEKEGERPFDEADEEGQRLEESEPPFVRMLEVMTNPMEPSFLLEEAILVPGPSVPRGARALFVKMDLLKRKEGNSKPATRPDTNKGLFTDSCDLCDCLCVAFCVWCAADEWTTMSWLLSTKNLQTLSANYPNKTSAHHRSILDGATIVLKGLLMATRCHRSLASFGYLAPDNYCKDVFFNIGVLLAGDLPPSLQSSHSSHPSSSPSGSSSSATSRLPSPGTRMVDGGNILKLDTDKDGQSYAAVPLDVEARKKVRQ